MQAACRLGALCRWTGCSVMQSACRLHAGGAQSKKQRHAGAMSSAAVRSSSMQSACRRHAYMGCAVSTAAAGGAAACRRRACGALCVRRRRRVGRVVQAACRWGRYAVMSTAPEGGAAHAVGMQVGRALSAEEGAAACSRTCRWGSPTTTEKSTKFS